ncbi:MAG: integral rane sensor signal transduction histidine kinase [Caproiciproducens sp.]|nr:integral rane sensor signal transduction histidine kinase [Caproiciproducens sp.]
MNESRTRMLHAMIESTALAMDRFRATQQRIKFNEEIAQERYRGNLLRSISHDLRTPLSGIIGTSEMLLNMLAKDDRCYPLMAGIHKDANWLHSLVENILSLIRLQDGKLVLNKEEEAARPCIGLGLAICDAAVKAHGGSIMACNRTDGPGVELIFTLPLEVNKL